MKLSVLKMKYERIRMRNDKPRIESAKRFRLSFVNENTLHTVWSIRMSQLRAWVLGIIAIACAACLATVIIMVTPLRSLLPGYLGTEQRQTHIINTMRIDSLAMAIDISNAYIDNLTSILNGTTDTTSIRQQLSESGANYTLVDPTEEEKAFIKQWDERERYNLRVLTPLAAEGMIFDTPIQGAAIDSLYTSPTIRLALHARRGAPIASIYSGTIIGCDYTIDKEICIIIQHPNDFVSRYTGISEAFVAIGDKVRSGQALGLVNNRTKGTTQQPTIEMWHKGASINPLDYLSF